MARDDDDEDTEAEARGMSRNALARELKAIAAELEHQADGSGTIDKAPRGARCRRPPRRRRSAPLMARFRYVELEIEGAGPAVAAGLGQLVRNLRTGRAVPVGARCQVSIEEGFETFRTCGELATRMVGGDPMCERCAEAIADEQLEREERG